MKSKIQSLYPLLFFTICCIIWILVVLKLRIFNISIIEKNGVLPYTFNWWDNNPINKHLFLGNFQDHETSRGTVYTTYTYPFYFFNYVILFPLHFIFNISYEKAQNILPFLNVLFFATTIYHLKKIELKKIIDSKNIYLLFLIFLIIGLLICNSLPWTSMLRYNLENFHMCIAILFCILSTTCVNKIETNKKDKVFLITGLIISFITPIYFPSWLLCYIYTENELKLRKKIIWNLFYVTLSTLINYIAPLIAANSLNLRSSASGYLYRSGLDGSNTYFDSILSVFYNPQSYQQTVSTIFLIASTIIIGKYITNQSKIFFNQFKFLLIPILTTVILFPQFSSIHMYFIELLIVIPCIFMICYWCINFELINKIKPNKFIISTIFILFLIMSQLIELVRRL